MPLGGSGLLTEAVLGKANEKLEQAIEDLRIKYEKKAQVEAEAAAAKAKEKAAEVEGKKSTEPEMSMEDPELEALRQVGGSTVDVETWARLSFSESCLPAPRTELPHTSSFSRLLLARYRSITVTHRCIEISDIFKEGLSGRWSRGIERDC